MMKNKVLKRIKIMTHNDKDVSSSQRPFQLTGVGSYRISSFNEE